MSSKKLTVSPMTSLISQWCHQNQSPLSSSDGARATSYRILLQSTTGLATRLHAANSLSTFGKEKAAAISQEEEEKIYRRAGLRTPSESAQRDLFGGLAWLVRILEIMADLEEDCQIVLIRTQTRDSLFVPQRFQSRITILDGSRDPWGWDNAEEEEKEPDGTGISLRDLPRLFEDIRASWKEKSGTPVLLVWESLTPLLLVHGFDQTLRFLQALDTAPYSSRAGQTKQQDIVPILQLWSVRRETLTPSQHAKMEDATNALLFSNRGEMTLMRQGIRETGNLVRESLPFRLVENQNLKAAGESSRFPFRLEEEDDVLSSSNTKEGETTMDDTTPSQQEGASRGNQFGATSTTTQKPGRSKIQLRLQSDDDAVASRQATAAATADSSTNPPRIYLQDDDPEFDDMDEEDPDDDLDI